jgi:hypothetical protein
VPAGAWQYASQPPDLLAAGWPEPELPVSRGDAVAGAGLRELCFWSDGNSCD